MESKLSLNLIKNWQELCKEIVFSDLAPTLLQNRVISVDEYRYILSHSEEPVIENLLLVLVEKDDEVLARFGKCLEKDYSWLAEKLNEGCMSEEGMDEIDASPISRLDIENEQISQDIYNNSHNLNSINRNIQLNNRVIREHRNLERRQIIESKVKNGLRPKIQNADALLKSSDKQPELITPVLNEEVTDEVITILRRTSAVSRSWTTIAHSLGLTDRVNDIRIKVVLFGEDMSMCIVYLIKEWIETCSKTATLSALIGVLRSEKFNGAADNLTKILHRKPENASLKAH